MRHKLKVVSLDVYNKLIQRIIPKEMIYQKIEQDLVETGDRNCTSFWQNI